MADYQFGPFERVSSSNAPSMLSSDNDFRVFYQTLLVTEPTTSLDPYLLREAPLYLPPVLFSRIDVPSPYNFAPRYKSTEYIELEERSQKLPINRKPRPNFGHVVGFQDASPMVPHPLAVERMLSRHINNHPIYLKLQKLFEERPVWIRSGILYHLQCDPRSPVFKFGLLVQAYYMPQGPWGRSWIRFGYDPRTDPESRVFQVIDFRLHSHVLIRKVLENTTRRPGTSSMVMNRRFRSGRRDLVQPTWAVDEHQQASTSNSVKVESELIENEAVDEVEGLVADVDDTIADLRSKGQPQNYDFRFGPHHIPTAQQCMYCLCDIDLPGVQQIVTEKPVRTKADSVDGWIKPGGLTTIRKLMTQFVKDWCTEHEEISPAVQ